MLSILKITEAPTPLNDVSNGSTFLFRRKNEIKETFRLSISLEIHVKTIKKMPNKSTSLNADNRT